jgi:hypothetical protein
MPIKINLLAEEQAAEDLRRRDPIKRAIYVAVGLVVLLLVWAGINWSNLSKLDGAIKSLNDEKTALEKPAKETETNKKKVAETQRNIDMLKKLAVNRPLWAPVLDSLQRALVEDVHILRLKVDQVYQITPAVIPPKGSGIKGKPATSKQVIMLTVEAQDNSPRLDNYNRFREQLAIGLKDHMGTNGTVLLKTLNPARENEEGKKFQTFSLECVFTEVVR